MGTGVVTLSPIAGPATADRRLHKLSCYQFAVASAGPVPIEVKLPAGITGVAELGYAASTNNGSVLKTHGIEGSGTLSMSPTLNPARYILIVRTENTAGGQPMGVGIGASAPTPNHNSTAQTAISSRLGEYVNSATATPGVSATYSFFPQRDGLVKQNLTATFTSNQTVTYQVAQQTGPSTFVPYGSATTLTNAQSGQKVLVSPSNSANATNTTTPYGLLVTVTSNNTGAPANEAFKLRVATADNAFTGIGITYAETTSGYYPLNGVATQAVNYIDLAAFVRDVVGYGVPNEKIKVVVKQNLADSTRDQTFNYTTDMTGSFARRFTFTACAGSVIYSYNYGPIGSPRDHWNGSHQNGRIIIDALDSGLHKEFDFTRICSETYLGYY
jgi:hypothetical protein